MLAQNYLLLAAAVVVVAATEEVVVPEGSLKRKSPLRNKSRELPLAQEVADLPTSTTANRSTPPQLELSAEVTPLPLG